MTITKPPKRKCRACKRPLKNPSTTGYGPKCERTHTTPKTPPTPKPTTKSRGPGEQQIPLFDHPPWP